MQSHFSARHLTFFVLLLANLALGAEFVEFTVAAANISSGNRQSYDEGHGIRLFQGAHPDVVMIQELNYGNNSESAIREFTDRAFGRDFFVYREAHGQIPNGIISRFRILESGEIHDPSVGNRSLVWALLDLPGSHELLAISVHLLTGSPERRAPEARLLVDFVKKKLRAGDYLVIGGDFNTKSREEGVLRILGSVVTDRHKPTGPDGREGTSANHDHPYDWVLPNPLLDQAHVPLRIPPGAEPAVEGRNTFSNGLVLDSRNFPDLAAIAPVQKSDSGAANMQHHMVLKRYRIEVK